MASQFGLNFDKLSDAEVIDSLKYNVFPNLMIFGSPGLPQIMLFMPDGDDPKRCVIETLIFRPVPPGEERPLPAEPYRISEAQSYCEVPGIDKFLGHVLDQDTSIMRWQCEGMRASKKGKETLSSYQESRIRHFHDTLDKYLG
jgi:hypothetical protein